MVDRRYDSLRGEDWVGQDIDATVVDHYEAWRFFTSGQSNQLRGIGADWRPHQEAPVPRGFSSVIEVWEILYYVTEVFELAARLALAGAEGDSVVVDVKLTGLAGRGLVVGQRGRADFVQPYSTTMPELSRTVTLARDQLISRARGEAVDMSVGSSSASAGTRQLNSSPKASGSSLRAHRRKSRPADYPARCCSPLCSRRDWFSGRLSQPPHQLSKVGGSRSRRECVCRSALASSG
jgi:hypothetical protein